MLHTVGEWEREEVLGVAQRHEYDGGTPGQSIFRG